MNREQRRHAERHGKDPVKSTSVEMQHGHDGERVCIVFSVPVRQLRMTEAEARDLITCVESNIKALQEHIAQAMRNNKTEGSTHE